MTKTVTINEAESHLEELLELVNQGEEILIEKNNRPLAKLVAMPPTKKQRIFGQHKGKAWLSDDFNTPLPDQFWLGGKD